MYARHCGVVVVEPIACKVKLSCVGHIPQCCPTAKPPFVQQASNLETGRARRQASQRACSPAHTSVRRSRAGESESPKRTSVVDAVSL